ncbi:unnamed protein product [Rotaria sordida]|uniref:Sodium-dependent multivitamin transporter n=1 Tax=Rotaria sordida TaxID=392033 RepID=A0A819THF1_9BILA|nr:unnamed protein product [Rotaria sordida]
MYLNWIDYAVIALLLCFGWFIGTYFTVTLFIPKFRQIECASIYSYLERRFSLTVRIAVTINFILIIVTVNLYGPSLALSQVTGLNLWLTISACGLICTLYTSIGGMKAVIWTDVIQSIIMFLGVILSIVFGFMDSGGVRKVFEIASAGDRLNLPSLSLNPSIRYTVFGLMVGSSLYAIAGMAVLQISAQRYLCVKSTRAAQGVAWLGYIFTLMTLLLSSLVALILYAKYSQCDPFRAKIIKKPDQIYPFFVIQTFGRYPGFTGLFIGSILSASLSTVSSGINSITTVILEDIYKRISIFPSISGEREALISKILSSIFGILTTLIAFLMSYFENNISVIVYQVVGSLTPPILSVFLLGFFAPRVNSRVS